MDPGAEGNVPVGSAVDHKRVRVAELGRVVVGRREVEQHLVSGGDVGAVVADFGLGDPGHSHGRVVTEELLDRGR